MATKDLSDLGKLKADLKEVRKLSQLKDNLPSDLAEALKDVAKQIELDTGALKGSLASLDRRISLKELLAEGRENGTLTKGVERQLTQDGREVIKLSKDAARKLERLGKVYDKWVGESEVALGELERKVTERMDKFVDAMKDMPKVAGTPPETLQIGKEAIRVSRDASGMYLIERAKDGTTFKPVDILKKDKAVSKFQKLASEISENAVGKQREAFTKATSLINDFLGDTKGSIEEFKTGNLGKLESRLGKEITTSKFAEREIAKNAEQGLMHGGEGALGKVSHTPGTLGGAAVGAAAGYMLSDDDSKGRNSVIGGGIGAALGNLVSRIFRKGASVAMGAASTERGLVAQASKAVGIISHAR